MAKKRKANSPTQSNSPVSVGVMEEIRKLREEVSDLRFQVRSLELQHDSLQQRSRLGCLIFSGPAIPTASPQEDAKEIIKSLLQRYMSFELDVNQVSTVFRVHSKLFVEFTTASPGSNRDQLYRTKTRLRGSGLFIAESLTPYRQELFQNLLRLKKDQTIFTAFTRSGELFVRKTRSSSPVKIGDHAALQQLRESGRPQGRAQAGGGGCLPPVPSAELMSAVPSHGGGQVPVADPPPTPDHHLAHPVPLVASAAVPPQATSLTAAPFGDTCSEVAESALVRAPASANLGLPLRPVESSRPPQSSPSRMDSVPPGGRRGLVALDGDATARTSVPVGAGRREFPTTRKATSTSPSTLRVSVRGRSRVINICNENDVVETLGDLRIATREPGHGNEVDRFLSDLDQRVDELCDGAEAGQLDRKTAISARRVRAAADRWLRVSGRPGRES